MTSPFPEQTASEKKSISQVLNYVFVCLWERCDSVQKDKTLFQLLMDVLPMLPFCDGQFGAVTIAITTSSITTLTKKVRNIQHNGIQHNNIRLKDNDHNNSQPDKFWQFDIQHNSIQLNDTLHKDTA